MSAIEKIRKGILEKNWSLVVSGYNSITGENINVEEDIDDQNSSHVNLVKEIENILDKYKKKDTVSIESNSVKQTKMTKKRGRPRKENKEEKENSSIKNEIVDNIPIIEEKAGKIKFITSEPTEEDIKISEFLAKVKKDKRKEFSSGKCHMCGVETNYVIKSMDEVVYMCNDCVKKKKKG